VRVLKEKNTHFYFYKYFKIAMYNFWFYGENINDLTKYIETPFTFFCRDTRYHGFFLTVIYGKIYIIGIGKEHGCLL